MREKNKIKNRNDRILMYWQSNVFTYKMYCFVRHIQINHFSIYCYELCRNWCKLQILNKYPFLNWQINRRNVLYFEIMFECFDETRKRTHFRIFIWNMKRQLNFNWTTHRIVINFLHKPVVSRLINRNGNLLFSHFDIAT